MSVIRPSNNQQSINFGFKKVEGLDEHIDALKTQRDEPLEKPLVHFDEDRIDSESIHFDTLDVIIAEGTYTGMLQNVDLRAFIDRTYKQTKMTRAKRARDPNVAFIEQVLAIEHEIISKQKTTADVIIAPPQEAVV